jgi:hypothetical protein
MQPMSAYCTNLMVLCNEGIFPSTEGRTEQPVGTRPTSKATKARSVRLIAAVAFGAAVAAIASTNHLWAQTAKSPARVAVLNPFSPPEPGFEAFRSPDGSVGRARPTAKIGRPWPPWCDGSGGFNARDKEAPARPGLQFPEESRPVVSRRVGQL